MKVVELTGVSSIFAAVTIESTEKVTGYIEKIEFDFNNTLNTLDLAITAEGITSQEVLTVSDIAAEDNVWYPRNLGSKAADSTAFTNYGEKIFVNNASFKVVAAQAGQIRTVRLLIHLSDGKA